MPKKKKEKRATTNFVSPLPQCTMQIKEFTRTCSDPSKHPNLGKWDAFTKYVELIAITEKQAQTVAAALFKKWLCQHVLRN